MYSLADFLLSIILLVLVTFLCFIKYFNGAVPPKSKVCLVGKTALVTGANRGIGLEVAIALASRGCRVIIACRNNLNLVEARQKIIDKTGNVNIEAVHLNLLSLDSVRRFAEAVNQTEKRLDILIHNALLGRSNVKVTEDGLHPLVQVSHFGPFLLTHLLLDLMKKPGRARIIFVSSIAVYMSNLTTEKLNPCHEKLSAREVTEIYANNKLCNLISAITFSEKLKDYGITVNAVHPGLVNTTIFDAITMPGDSWKFKLFHMCFVMPFAKSPDEGSFAIIDAATDQRYRRTSGEFLFDRGSLWLPLSAKNRVFREEIWKVSEECVKLRPEERLP